MSRAQTTALSGSAPPTSGFTPTGSGGTAGFHIVPEPPRVLTMLVADLFQPAVVTPALRRNEVRGRLLGMLRYLLAARRILILHREQTDASDPNQQSYEAWLADQAGSLRRIGTSAPVQATPLPLVRAQTTGVLIERPRHNRQVDPAVAGLFDSTPLLLLALPREYRGDTDGILALSLDAMPHDGEVALALVLVRRAARAMTLSGAPGDDHMLPWGGRTACRWADDLHASARSRELSPREREVVHLVAAGLRNKEIARRLQISEKTVKFHLGRIFDKLAVDSRTEVVRRAIGTGLVSPEEMV